MKIVEDSILEEQPTWRLWGEEKVDGAIYTVYLKKVRYHTPTKSTNSDDEDSISHLEWETVRVRFVKAGTLARLVDALASDTGELESTYINVFLATYRTFASAKQVLNLLTERYEQLGNMSKERSEQHRRTLRQALHVWLDQFPEDFNEPPNYPCLTQLETFCRKIMPGSELDTKVQRKGKLLRNEGSVSESPLIQQLLGSHHSPSRYSHKSQSLPSYALPGFQDIIDIPTRHFAHQITAMDNDLFKRVVPHQCLGSVWSRRDKNRDRDAATVVATIEQFNAVSYRVISTVLIDADAKNTTRGRVISSWIDIAQELRVLKNFSSLKAIVSGLQSNPVYRLKKAWSTVSREKLEIFEELARIFSEENNAVAQRELLVREGTARFADTAGENDHHMQKVLQKHQENSRGVSYGTIPYLGTFLTDLTMIDTAIPDIVAEGLINFDKRRKEFEVLAQIKLLQGAANAYSIDRDPRFTKWFESVLIMDELEAFELSCQIEPLNQTTQNSGSKESRFRRRITPLGQHRKNDSIASTVSGSSNSSTPMHYETDGSVRDDDESKMTASLNDSLRSRVSSASSACSTPSIDTSLASLGTPSRSDRVSDNPGDPAPDPFRTPEFYIIRVSLESSTEATEGVIMYKSIMLSNREHTREVICSAMLKHGLEGSPDDYNLAQMLPDKELMIPSNANVYYAINTSHDLNFVLRPRRPEVETVKERRRDTSRARRKLLGLAL
ncbi:ral guanine nucleotide dissociation stimulator isoform X2 [Eurytemora carolleeae]|uniref:ral guanine nucleotide dissociation stimulator isoform X2 n=1 Tax=Eurytemora carolleeae TaxID=1294199 RepID=UPI000C774EB1|nr:ral guanine nucleotide dissociation stimulator isoform X2 [Eurytemora carolleeae]|eukprot:XP_023320057.1 ral guanine nucleotide dissociation stimulator-like isoform X2 [Eurytemora affinis]